MRQLVTKYQPPGVVNKAGEIFVDEVTGQIKIGDGSTTNGVDSKPLTDAQITAGSNGLVGVTTGGALVIPTGGIIALTEVTTYVNMTVTGTAFTGPCELAGFDCTVAAGNITIYDNTSATGVVIVPTTALTVGRTEFMYKRALTLGCHVVLSGAATVNVLVG